MSQISQQRLIEMEAEMDRFEQEIQAGDDLPKVVIGSNTYNQVSAQLKMLRASSGVSAEERERKHQEVAAQLKMLRASTEGHARWNERPHSPPRDDSDDEPDYDEDRSRLVDRNEPPVKKQALDMPILPPPPPPPPSITTPFVPPQLRHHRPPPPPARPSMQGPPRMRPPPPPRHFGGPMGPGPMGGPPYGSHGGPYGGPHGGPGPGHFQHGPRPGYGPMGPGGPGPMRGPGPHMGPGPGFNMNMAGPRPMGGPMGSPPPQDTMSLGMYGVSTGEQHATSEEEKKEDEEKPKVIYSSAPVITVSLKKEKKEKKKRKKKPKEDPGTDIPASSTATPSSSSLENTTEVYPMAATSVFTPVKPEDDFHVADMEIDNQFIPSKKEKKKKEKKFVRMAAGTTWEDQSLAEWDPDDFRLFCGDLGNEVTDETLARAFSKYPSFVKAKVLRDKRSNKTKGYGFVSFKDPNDYVRAMREMNGKYVGNRPIKLRKSNWRDRNIEVVKKKDKEKKRLGLK